MTPDDFIAAERIGHKALRIVHDFAGPNDRRYAGVANHILSEVRHFAVCWDDCRRHEDAGRLTAEQADIIRRDLKQRLLALCTPTRP